MYNYFYQILDGSIVPAYKCPSCLFCNGQKPNDLNMHQRQIETLQHICTMEYDH